MSRNTIKTKSGNFLRKVEYEAISFDDNSSVLYATINTYDKRFVIAISAKDRIKKSWAAPEGSKCIVNNETIHLIGGLNDRIVGYTLNTKLHMTISCPTPQSWGHGIENHGCTVTKAGTTYVCGGRFIDTGKQNNDIYIRDKGQWYILTAQYMKQGDYVNSCMTKDESLLIILKKYPKEKP